MPDSRAQLLGAFAAQLLARGVGVEMVAMGGLVTCLLRKGSRFRWETLPAGWRTTGDIAAEAAEAAELCVDRLRG